MCKNVQKCAKMRKYKKGERKIKRMKFRLVKDRLKESVKKINNNESKATMKDGTEFNIWTEYDSAGSEQTNCTKIAYIGDNWLDERDRVIRENLLGYLSYSYLRNEKPKTAYVQMIHVKDSMRRKGIATALIDSLKQDFGNNIEYGYTTDDGTKLLKGLGIRESKDINESINNKKIKVYRVGELHSGTNFFTDDLDYYEKSDTRYKKEDAKEYELDLSNCKVWEPIKELGLDVYTWSTI